MKGDTYTVRTAQPSDCIYVDAIIQAIAESARQRGTGICRRSYEQLKEKIENGNAVIATCNNAWTGFCYLQSWDNNAFVSHCALIIAEEYRNSGIAVEIKRQIFELSRKLYPDAKIFGLTTSGAVMKINTRLGYKPVTYSEITHDEIFWNACRSCVNYPILLSKQKKQCICTAMIFEPSK